MSESFADEAAAESVTATVPPKYRNHASWDDKGGEGATGPIREKVTDTRRLLELAGLDPDTWRIVGKVSQWTKTHNGKPDTYSFFFQFEPITAEGDNALDLPTLYAAARTKPRARVKTPPSERATVVVMADPQIGKTGHRGGTPELIDRMQQKREELAVELKQRRPARVLYADAGDGFENFESGGNPMFTNDLSLPQQMDCYGTETYAMIEAAHKFAPVDVMVVTSNHTAWRKGKQQLGRAEDDLGLHVHRQVQKVAVAAGLEVAWHFPAPYDESVLVDLIGTPIGMVHGNQFGPGQAVIWWEKQTFGAQAVNSADVLITGHYHAFGSGVAGRNPVTGRQRWWLGAPTLDNGSDWHRQTAGRDSDPGMLIFDVTPDGFDLKSLTIL